MGMLECILQISASYNNVRYMWKVHWTSALSTIRRQLYFTYYIHSVVLNLQFDIYIFISNIYNIALSIIDSSIITNNNELHF